MSEGFADGDGSRGGVECISGMELEVYLLYFPVRWVGTGVLVGCSLSFHGALAKEEYAALRCLCYDGHMIWD